MTKSFCAYLFCISVICMILYLKLETNKMLWSWTWIVWSIHSVFLTDEPGSVGDVLISFSMIVYPINDSRGQTWGQIHSNVIDYITITLQFSWLHYIMITSIFKCNRLHYNYFVNVIDYITDYIWCHDYSLSIYLIIKRQVCKC